MASCLAALGAVGNKASEPFLRWMMWEGGADLLAKLSLYSAGMALLYSGITRCHERWQSNGWGGNMAAVEKLAAGSLGTSLLWMGREFMFSHFAAFITSMGVGVVLHRAIFHRMKGQPATQKEQAQVFIGGLVCLVGVVAAAGRYDALRSMWDSVLVGILGAHPTAQGRIDLLARLGLTLGVIAGAAVVARRFDEIMLPPPQSAAGGTSWLPNWAPMRPGEEKMMMLLMGSYALMERDRWLPYFVDFCANVLSKGADLGTPQQLDVVRVGLGVIQTVCTVGILAMVIRIGLLQKIAAAENASATEGHGEAQMFVG